MLITDVKRSFHCHSTALSRVNAARRRLKRDIKRPLTAGLPICRSRASTVHLQAWFKGCSPVVGLHDKGWCQSLHNFIVHCRGHPHKPRKGSRIFVTQLDHQTVVKPQLRSPRNPVTHPDVPYHPPPPPSSSLKDMLCLYQLVVLVLEHEEEDITAFRIHVHPLTSRLQLPRSSENYGLYMPQIRSDTEVIQK